MMKKNYLLLLFSVMTLGAFAQSSRNVLPKLSPATRMYLKDLQKNTNGDAPGNYIYRRLANGKLYVPGIIKVANAGMVGDKIGPLGVLVGTRAGDIWTVSVPYDKLPDFTSIEGISYIQIDEPVKPQMDVARKATKVDSVHGGYGFTYPFTGQDVIVGVIDFGFDYTHPAFFDTLGTKYRVKKVWELNTTGTPPTGYTYGHEIVGDVAIQAQGTDNAEQTHGTAVAGMSSGSGWGSTNNTKLTGMAFKSEMVFVGVRRDSIGAQWMSSGFSDFIDGVNYIFQYAQSVGKPAVINISWGSQSGPHDGSTLMNQACNNLSGPGKIIVMSAGNEGQEQIHIAKTFTASDTVVNTFTTFTDLTYKRTWVDVWGETGKTFCGQVTLYKAGVPGNKTGFFCLDDNTHSTYLIGDNGLDTCFIEFITSTAEFNGKPRLTINMFNKTGDSTGINISGHNGTIHMWDEYYYYGYKYKYSSSFASLNVPGYIAGNSNSTVSDMGAASSVLMVGAYVSKNKFTNLTGGQPSYPYYNNQIAPFSSLGPLANGDVRPDIAAPGATIATAVSSYDTTYQPGKQNAVMLVKEFQHPTSGKKYYYGEFLGTSASSPAAAGIVALMLEANPSLTPKNVKDIIAETAIEDNYTGTIPVGGNNIWGNGKINAYAAVKKARQTNSVYKFSGQKLDCLLYPNPSNGNFSLDFTGDKTETLKIEIVNITGAVVASFDWKVDKGLNHHNINTGNLSKGVYIVKISSTNGSCSIKTNIE